MIRLYRLSRSDESHELRARNEERTHLKSLEIITILRNVHPSRNRRDQIVHRSHRVYMDSNPVTTTETRGEDEGPKGQWRECKLAPPDERYESTGVEIRLVVFTTGYVADETSGSIPSRLLNNFQSQYLSR